MKTKGRLTSKNIEDRRLEHPSHFAPEDFDISESLKKGLRNLQRNINRTHKGLKIVLTYNPGKYLPTGGKKQKRIKKKPVLASKAVSKHYSKVSKPRKLAD